MCVYQVISNNGTKQLPLYTFHQIFLILPQHLFAIGTIIFHRSALIGKKIIVNHFFLFTHFMEVTTFTEQIGTINTHMLREYKYLLLCGIRKQNKTKIYFDKKEHGRYTSVNRLIIQGQGNQVPNPASHP